MVLSSSEAERLRKTLVLEFEQPEILPEVCYGIKQRLERVNV